MKRVVLLATMVLIVVLASVPAFAYWTSAVVECGTGGSNVAWTVNTGMSPTGAFSTAPGCTASKALYASYSSKAGMAVDFKPNFEQSGWYNVSYTFPNGNYNVVEKCRYQVYDGLGATSKFDLDLYSGGSGTAGANAWTVLGKFYFNAGQSDSGRVRLVGDDCWWSGTNRPGMSAARIYADGFKFDFVSIPEPGSMLALGSGLIGLLGILRRRSA